MGDRAECNRAVVKLSGNAFCPPGRAGFEEKSLQYAARELKEALQVCSQLAVVVGGGNLMRGAAFWPSGLRRIRADRCGMLATVANSLMFQDYLERAEVPSCVLSAIGIEGMVDAFEVERCLSELEHGRLVLLAGGTGQPFFTTDTAAALRAVQVGADLMLKATRVDGVYAADPEREADARLYRRLSYRYVIEHGLEVMDLSAVAVCMEHSLPVRVFNYQVAGNLSAALRGESVGTLIEGDNNGSG